MPGIKKAMKQIAASKKPVLYTGGGIITSGASAELMKLAEQLSIPVVNTSWDWEVFRGTTNFSRYARYARNICGEYGNHQFGPYYCNRR